jgi:hypothetical protein
VPQTLLELKIKIAPSVLSSESSNTPRSGLPIKELCRATRRENKDISQYSRPECTSTSADVTPWRSYLLDEAWHGIHTDQLYDDVKPNVVVVAAYITNFPASGISISTTPLSTYAGVCSSVQLIYNNITII